MPEAISAAEPRESVEEATAAPDEDAQESAGEPPAPAHDEPEHEPEGTGSV